MCDNRHWWRNDGAELLMGQNGSNDISTVISHLIDWFPQWSSGLCSLWRAHTGFGVDGGEPQHGSGARHILRLLHRSDRSTAVPWLQTHYRRIQPSLCRSCSSDHRLRRPSGQGEKKNWYAKALLWTLFHSETALNPKMSEKKLRWW